MKLFFKADKYITRVESPRVNSARTRKSQVLLYIDKYFDMYNHEYLGSVYTACKEYIEEMMDEEVMQEIYDYFRDEAESDSLEEAIRVLGPDYEEMEIRLVRLKFLCEVAN